MPFRSPMRIKVDISHVVVLISSFCFLLFLIPAVSLITWSQPSKAITGLGLVTTQTLSLSSSGNINLAIIPTSAGVLASASHNLTASTNMPTGYSLTLDTPVAPTLTTTAGTYALPTQLANNTWGYAMANTGNFDTTYTTPIPSITSKWANPSEGAIIKKTINSATNDNTTVYYAAKIDMNQPSGTYTNTVRYTVTSNIANILAPTITSITPSSGTSSGGTNITIVGTGFTVNDQSVTTAVTIDNQACTNVTISSNVPTTGQDTITCNTPAHAVGVVDVAVTTWGGITTKTSGYTYIEPVYNFSYTGAAQTFTVPMDGYYNIELWGAQGGTTPNYLGRSRGGYTKGTIYLEQDETMYVYVGETGIDKEGATFNGGGVRGNQTSGLGDNLGFSGGGATDIRLASDIWNNSTSLRSRIMVAAGGGGATNWDPYLAMNYRTSHAGGLSGDPGTLHNSGQDMCNGKGGTQTTGGANGTPYTTGGISGISGVFGIGGNAAQSGLGAKSGGGGGGYYGGGGGSAIGQNAAGAGGGGGSSYISGHTGAVAITSASNQTPKAGCTTGTTNNTCSIHYSGKTFTNTLMIDGGGYNWTNVKGALQAMPNPAGGNYASGIGYSGNGYARITYLGRT